MSIGNRTENRAAVLPGDDSVPPNTPSAKEGLSWKEFGNSVTEDLRPSSITNHCVLQSLFYLLVLGPSFLAILSAIVYLGIAISDAIMRPILLASHVGNLWDAGPCEEEGTTKHPPSLFLLVVLAQLTFCLMLLSTNKLKDRINASWSGLLLLLFWYCNCTILFLDMNKSIVLCLDYLNWTTRGGDFSLLCAIFINLVLPAWYYLLRLVIQILCSTFKNIQDCTAAPGHKYTESPAIGERVGNYKTNERTTDDMEAVHNC